MTLLVVDVQKGITDERLYRYADFVRNTAALIDTARKAGVEVIYVQHDDGEGSGFSVGDDDFEIAPQVAPLADEKRYIKTVNSCFGNADFARYLAEKHENALMIVGLQTNFCIDATVKSAFDRGYKVIIPEGTNSTFDNDYMTKEATYNYYNKLMWPERFADCIPLEKAVELLLKA